MKQLNPSRPVPKAPARKQRVAVYVRARNDNPREADAAIREQEQTCQELADVLDADIVATYRDHGSTSDTTRPGLERLLTRVESGGIDLVVATDLDRLTRDLRVAVDLANRMHAAGAHLAVAGPAHERTNTPRTGIYV